MWFLMEMVFDEFFLMKSDSSIPILMKLHLIVGKVSFLRRLLFL